MSRKENPDESDNESSADRVRHAAVELFAARGFHGTGIRDLATAAGLRTSSLYHYMGTKEDLLADIMVDVTRPLGVAAEAMLAEIDSPSVGLATLVEHHVWLHARERLATSIADTEVRALTGAQRERVLAIRDAYQSCWKAMIHQGVATGEFTVDHPEVLATALLQMCTGVAAWFDDERGPLSLGELCSTYSNWALAMVRAQQDGKPVTRDMLKITPPPGFLP